MYKLNLVASVLFEKPIIPNKVMKVIQKGYGKGVNHRKGDVER